MKKIFTFLSAVLLAANVMAADTYVVAGVSALCGSNWNATDPNNAMTLQNLAGQQVYVKTYMNVPVGDNYEFKVVKNGTEWFGDANGQNVKFNVTAAGMVIIGFEPTTKTIIVQGEGVNQENKFAVDKVCAVGDGNGNWLNGESWNPAADVNKMTEVSPLVYEVTYNDVPAGTFKVKFALNGSWADNFGGEFDAFGKATAAHYNGGDIPFTLSETSNVKLTLDLSAFDITTTKGATFTISLVSGSTGLEDVEAAPAVRKVIENGMLYIIRDGVKYNALGAIAE